MWARTSPCSPKCSNTSDTSKLTKWCRTISIALPTTARMRERSACQSRFANYGEFLASLEMTAEIGPFVPVYLERITQLINKTNQFNLTTRRYTSAEVEAIAQDPGFITLYGRLADRFGDNGLVSVLIGRVFDETVRNRPLADELPRVEARNGTRHV